MRKKANADPVSVPNGKLKNGVNGGSGFDLPAVGTAQIVRTTIILPAETDQNLDLCRLKLGITRNELIKRAIHNFLVHEGFDPTRSPKNVGVSY